MIKRLFFVSFLFASLLMLGACLPATTGEVVVFEENEGLPESWLGTYEYIPKEDESFEPGQLPVLRLEEGEPYTAELVKGIESYGGGCVGSEIPGTGLYVLSFPRFKIDAGNTDETFDNVFFVIRKQDDILYVWDLLAGTLGPAPWRVDKVKNFLQKNPSKFDTGKPGLMFRFAS